MLLHILVLIGSIIILVKGSDLFVEASARIAKKLGVSELVIGLTLVAIGTTIPELATNIVASMKNDSGLIIGNIIGTNIANITLIIGITAIFALIKTTKRMLDRDGYIMVFAAFIFFIFIFIGKINVIGGIFLLSLYLAFILFLYKIKSDPEIESYRFKEFLNYYMKMDYLITIRESIIHHIIKNREKRLTKNEKKVYYAFQEGLIKNSIFMVVGLIGIIFGAKFLIEEAIWLAEFFKIATQTIGLSIVAIGTSLPELSVSFSAARKGFGSMVIGNIIGSNIANVFLVLGISSLITPIIMPAGLLIQGMIMLLISALLLLFIKSHWEITKSEGYIFIFIYVAFIMMIIFSNL